MAKHHRRHRITKAVQKKHVKVNYNAILTAAVLIVLAASWVYTSTNPRQATPTQDNTYEIPEYPDTYAPPEGWPALTLDRPVEGDIISGSIIGIRVTTANFQLVNAAPNKANVDNQGHISYVLDGSEVKRTMFRADSLANVAKGPHTLSVELRNNDNSPLNPAVTQVVRVTVV